MIVQVLYFDGCPHAAETIDLVQSTVARHSPEATLELITVEDDAAAKLNHSLGSPTVLVDGRDIEPAANGRTDYSHACRLYPNGTPSEAWLLDALEQTR